ncbi:hypothetical protein BVC93_24950 [Mycobacterium sp. MS1601]|uniref:universal stress protein n=1 Tax=Mycobacterium sp. MS1601 TaxID=1936029 RepID=UPI00097929EB|nr:universal stress protein [Mycobacterium sp. MS1601]AQA05113.1 hypothetical protein BVC93_24950 [Mycobacterium sp. MS1601]
MNEFISPVVVGVDGSAASLEAALWAVDEAMTRNTWLVLSSVVDPRDSDLSARLTSARRMLCSAKAFVQDAKPRAMVRAEVLVDDEAHAWLQHGRTASLLCLARHAGFGSGDSPRCPPVADVVRWAEVPVALVGRHPAPRPDDRWVVVVIDASTHAGTLWAAALAEARMRAAAVMMLAPPGVSPDDVQEELERSDPGDDLEVWAMPWTDDLSGLLAQANGHEQVVVINSAAGAVLDNLLDAGHDSGLPVDCSVLMMPCDITSCSRPAHQHIEGHPFYCSTPVVREPGAAGS